MRPPSPPLTTSPVLASVARKPTPIRTPGGTSGGAGPGAPGGRSTATWPTFGQVTLTTDPLPTMGDGVGVASAAGAGGGEVAATAVPAAPIAVSYTHLRAHETRHDLVCRLL